LRRRVLQHNTCSSKYFIISCYCPAHRTFFVGSSARPLTLSGHRPGPSRLFCWVFGPALLLLRAAGDSGLRRPWATAACGLCVFLSCCMMAASTGTCSLSCARAQLWCAFAAFPKQQTKTSGRYSAACKTSFKRIPGPLKGSQGLFKGPQGSFKGSWGPFQASQDLGIVSGKLCDVSVVVSLHLLVDDLGLSIGSLGVQELQNCTAHPCPQKISPTAQF